MGDLRNLSRAAHTGPWVVKNQNDTGSDVYVGGEAINSGFVGCFRSNRPLPKMLGMRMKADAEFVVALVNAYREGRLVEKDTATPKEGSQDD